MTCAAPFGWDPDRYRKFADERARPFTDLLARVDAEAPRTVVDLGCGTGDLTAQLARRWPGARVLGIDSSPDMVGTAPTDGGAEFSLGDVRDWAARSGSGAEDGAADVLVSNAALQWVPGHLSLLPGLVGSVAPGGWLAFQVPGSFAEPSHTILANWRPKQRTPGTADVAIPDAHDPGTYLHALRDLGCEVDAWETTYLHVPQGADPVFAWVSGTAARPTLQLLPDDVRSEFEEELKRRLRSAYPERGGATILPFRRVFVVARIPAVG